MSSRSSLRSPFALLLAAVATLAIGASACGGDASGSVGSGSDAPTEDTAEPSGPTVVIKSSTFTPDEIRAAPGETVTWVFRDKSLAHNVVGDGWTSPMQRGGRYTHRFDEAGTYSYRCSLHPGMKGKVDVSG